MIFHEPYMVDLCDGSHYKRICEIYTSPMEHKRGYWDIARYRRK